jgi:hypothetical protein
MIADLMDDGQKFHAKAVRLSSEEYAELEQNYCRKEKQ